MRIRHSTSAPRRRPARVRVRVGLVIVAFGAALAGPTSAAIAAPRPACVVSAGVTISGGRSIVVTGTPGYDSIDCRGSRKAITIYGMGSTYQTGNNISLGGDRIWGSRAGDVIWGEHPGVSTCTAGNDGVDIFGDGGNDQIHGSLCFSSLEGGPGNDVLIARGGVSVLDGQDGDDSIDLTGPDDGTGSYAGYGGAGNDHIFSLGGVGIFARGDDGNDLLDGSGGIDRLEGGDGDDFLNGNAGNDMLDASFGIDSLFGGDGDDFLRDGGAGEVNTYDGGLNATTIPPTDGSAWGDVCLDSDGTGSEPALPYGSGHVGNLSAIQDDNVTGCEYLEVRDLFS